MFLSVYTSCLERSSTEFSHAEWSYGIQRVSLISIHWLGSPIRLCYAAPYRRTGTGVHLPNVHTCISRSQLDGWCLVGWYVPSMGLLLAMGECAVLPFLASQVAGR
jgi:hypothetical protein